MSQNLPQICTEFALVYHKYMLKHLQYRFAVHFGTLSIHMSEIKYQIRKYCHKRILRIMHHFQRSVQSHAGSGSDSSEKHEIRVRIQPNKNEASEVCNMLLLHFIFFNKYREKITLQHNKFLVCLIRTYTLRQNLQYN